MFLFNEYIITEQVAQQIGEQPVPSEQVPPDGQPPEQVPPEQVPPEQVPPNGQPPEQVPPDGQPPSEQMPSPIEEPDISTDPQVIELKRLTIISKLERLQSNLWSKNIVIEELNTILEFASFFNYDLLIKLISPVLKIVKTNIDETSLY